MFHPHGCVFPGAPAHDFFTTCHPHLVLPPHLPSCFLVHLHHSDVVPALLCQGHGVNRPCVWALPYSTVNPRSHLLKQQQLLLLISPPLLLLTLLRCIGCYSCSCCLCCYCSHLDLYLPVLCWLMLAAACPKACSAAGTHCRLLPYPSYGAACAAGWLWAIGGSSLPLAMGGPPGLLLAAG